MSVGTPVVVTIDVEDWHDQLFGCPNPTIVEATMEHWLHVLAQRGSHATFFVVADLATRHPTLVRRIAAAGHEIASHTRSHRTLPTLSGADLLDELITSRRILERISNQPCIGFRPPRLQIGDQVRYLRALECAGYRYESSLLDDPDWSRPVAQATLLGRQVPLGGSYLRFLPQHVVEASVASSRSPVVYAHSYEASEPPGALQPSQWTKSTLRHALLHNVMTHRIERTISAVLAKFQAVTLSELMNQPSQVGRDVGHAVVA